MASMRDQYQESSSPHSEEWVGWCCSYCGAPLTPRGSGLLCRAEGRWFATRDGVHLLLPEERRVAIRAFQEIRKRVGRGRYRDAPEALGSDHRFREVLGLAEAAIGAGPWDVLQVGLGALLEPFLEAGHRVAVVDPGLEPEEAPAARGPRAEAELDALPLEPGRFDLVLAAGSLHYGPSLPRTLVELRRVTRRGGALVAFDSPVFRKRADGEARVAGAMKEERGLVGMAVPREARPGYLVREEMPEQFRDAGWSLQVLGWPGVLRERGEDLLRLLRGGRRPARYPVLFARRDG